MAGVPHVTDQEAPVVDYISEGGDDAVVVGGHVGLGEHPAAGEGGVACGFVVEEVDVEVEEGREGFGYGVVGEA